MYILYSIPLLLYGIPFAVALLMPGRKSLLGLAVLIGVPAIWLSILASNELNDPDTNGGLGAVIGAALIWYASAGLWAGIVTRTILLWMRRFNAGWVAWHAVAICGLVALPAVLTVSQYWRKW